MIENNAIYIAQSTSGFYQCPVILSYPYKRPSSKLWVSITMAGKPPINKTALFRQCLHYFDYRCIGTLWNEIKTKMKVFGKISVLTCTSNIYLKRMDKVYLLDIVKRIEKNSHNALKARERKRDRKKKNAEVGFWRSYICFRIVFLFAFSIPLMPLPYLFTKLDYFFSVFHAYLRTVLY